MSDVQRIANQVRMIAKDAREIGTQLRDQSRTLRHLADELGRIRVEGLSLSKAVLTLNIAARNSEAASGEFLALNGTATRYAAWLAAGNSGSGGSPGASSIYATPPDAPAALDDGDARLNDSLASRGLTLTDVSEFDAADNPLDPGDWRTEPSGSGPTRDDMEWAVKRWDDTIAPGLRRGLDYDDFAAMDARSGATGYRRLVGVWDTFLGTDAISASGASPSGDGRSLNGGRHRIELARLLHIRWLPVRFFRP